MRLHDLPAGNPVAWITGYWYGGNGRPLGRGGAFRHIIRTERTPPPPMPPTDEPGWRYTERQYWQPWAPPMYDTPLTMALCGGPKSAARFARFNTYNHWRAMETCPACLGIAETRRLTVRDLQELVRTDPWMTQIEWTNRRTTPDPVTGL